MADTKRAFKRMVTGGDYYLSMPDSDKHKWAYELWQRFMKENDGPEYTDDDGYNVYCFFCDGLWKMGKTVVEAHSDDCIYIVAKKLVEAE